MQWYWYAEMISKDMEIDNERTIQLIEYLASFWDPKAVSHARMAREESKRHRFMDDEEFEKMVMAESYKDDPIVQAVIKYRSLQDAANNKSDDMRDFRSKKIRLPTDLSNLVDTISRK